jgi:branched-chain amino acid transport system substrate-binding protein
MFTDEMWAKDVNARGGLLGRKVELTFVDNKSNAEAAAAIYERFIQQNFDFIFEDSGSVIVTRESTLAEQHKRLFLAPNGFARSIYKRGYKYVFYTGAAVSEDLNIGLANLLASLPPASRPKTIGYVTVENIGFVALTKGVQELLKPLNLTPVLDITYPTNINDATPLVSNVKQKAPEIIFQTGLYNDTVLFVRAAAQQSMKAKLVAIGIAAAGQSQFVPSVGADVVEGMVFATGWDPRLKTHQNQEFVKGFQGEKGFVPPYTAAHAFARWQILEQAINATKSLDNEVLRNHIASATFRTVIGEVRYNAEGYRSPADTVVIQFQKGNPVIVWPKSDATGSLIYPMPGS